MRFVTPLSVLCLVSGCSEEPQLPLPQELPEPQATATPDPVTEVRYSPGDPIPLEAIGIEVEFGARVQNNRLSLFHKPHDAAFVADEVFVLDSAPPWIRVFDRKGTFLRAMVLAGEGPGEAVSATSIVATGDEGVLVTHLRGIVHLNREGAVVRTIPPGARASYGSLQGCGSDIIELSRTVGDRGMRGLVTRSPPDRSGGDTIAVLEALRMASPRHQPWFAAVRDHRILFYTEEEVRYRLLEFDCVGGSLREIAIDSLGPGETGGTGPGGSLSITLPRPPLPAGVALLEDRALWAAQVVRSPATGSGPADSVTVIHEIRENGIERRLYLRGWYQLYDSDPAGNLLFGNSYGFNRTWGLSPHVVMVRGASLLAALDELGVPVGH